MIVVRAVPAINLVIVDTRTEGAVDGQFHEVRPEPMELRVRIGEETT